MMDTPVRFGRAPSTSTFKTFDGTERRESVRFPSSLDAICWQPDSPNGEPWSAIVQNISVGGVGLISRRPIEQGARFLIKLQSNFVDMSGPMQARAVHLSEKGDEGWLIGCEFLNELAPSEQKRLL
jgi:PilZ domain